MEKEILERLDPKIRARIEKIKNECKHTSLGYRGVLIGRFEGYLIALSDMKMINEEERIRLYRYVAL